MPISLNLRVSAEILLDAYEREPRALEYDKKNVRQFQNTDSITYELIKHAELFNIIKGRVYPLKPNVFEDLLDKDRKRDIQTRLREIEKINIEDTQDDQWKKLSHRIDQLIYVICQVNNVGFAIATKILHPLRPGLIPIADTILLHHFVATKCQITKRKIKSLQWFSEVVRDYCLINRDELEKVQKIVSSHVKFEVSVLRILDFLVWSENRFHRLRFEDLPLLQTTKWK